MGSRKDKPKTVAVIGTGLAGLVTAFLLNRDEGHSVEVFENGARASLDTASVSVPCRWDTSQIERVDVPMRAFSHGYYPNLQAMYDFLDVEYRRQRMLFAFSNGVETRTGPGSRGSRAPYFIHASNNHIFPPIRPPGSSLHAFLLELSFVGICYLWFTLSCYMFPARDDESLGMYLRRVCLPQAFTKRYILPLLAAIATCSHDELLGFPAHDVVNYRRRLIGGEQFVVTHGIQDVQKKLLTGLAVNYHCEVELVDPRDTQVKVSWRQQGSEVAVSRYFDEVVLAVPPNVTARIFAPSKQSLARLTTTSVKTIVHSDTSHTLSRESLNLNSKTRDAAASQVVCLHTESREVRYTEATHAHNSGVMVTTSPVSQLDQSKVHAENTFTRVLRTVDGRRLTNALLGLTAVPHKDRSDSAKWRNGHLGVWVVGSWCWDGLPLLEGCVVSSARVMRAMQVEVPWEFES